MVEDNHFLRRLIDPTYPMVDSGEHIPKDINIKLNKTTKGNLAVVSYGKTKFSCEVNIKVGVPSSSCPNQGELSEFNFS